MVREEELREAFTRVREEIYFLKNEILALKSDINNLRDQIKHILSVQTQTSTHPERLQHLNAEFGRIKPYLGSSIGNKGASTNKQTNKQTHLQHIFRHIEGQKQGIEATKAELKRLFLNLTKQEFHIYSILYELESNIGAVTYKDLAGATKLTETSVRGYVNRLIEKSVPIFKEKRNNKDVFLKISPEFKQIETLSNLIKLRAAMETN